MKTAEEILHETGDMHEHRLADPVFHSTRDMVLHAMQRYADQFDPKKKPFVQMTEERLVSLFLFEEPHIISFEYRKADFKQYLKALRSLQDKKLITIIEKTTKKLTYKYHAEQTT